MTEPYPGPVSYPLILRTRTFAVWRPIVGLILMVLGAIVAAYLLLPLLALTVALDYTGPYQDAFEAALGYDEVTWQSMLYLNLSLAALILVAWIVVRGVHRLPIRWLASVRPGFRWRFFWACMGLSLVAIAAQVLVGQFLPGLEGDLSGEFNTFAGATLALTVVVLLTTPLQAIGEEYAFRGYLLQAFGALASRIGEALRLDRRSAALAGIWLAIALSGLLFAVAHGVQNAPLFLDRFLFGVMAGFLVWRTGGLEAGIALHIWNNLVAFGIEIAIGDVGEALNISEVSWWNLVGTFTQNGVFLVLVLLVARRMGISWQSDPPSTTPQSGDVLMPPAEPM